MTDQLLDEDELVMAIKRLVISLTPILKDSGGSMERAEEHILHLEASDANFHRYDYVKRVRGCIDAELGELMENEIEKHSIHPNNESGGAESVVGRITERILSSPQYANMKGELQSKVAGACQYLLQNFEQEFGAYGGGGRDSGDMDGDMDGERGLYGAGAGGLRGHEGADGGGGGHRHHRHAVHPDVFYSDGESSFGESSLNHSSILFMNNEHSRIIANGLEKKQSLVSRQESLKKLASVTMVDDVLNCESWTQIRQGLQDALAESDIGLWTQSLKFIARGFSSTNQSEMYKVLVEYLEMQFHMGKNAIPQIHSGLDTSTPENIKLLKAFRLLNEFQRQVPQYWVRYPEKFVDEVIELTLGLLSSQPASTQMNPIHFLAVIDPQACWFVKWMHGHYSRAPVLKALKGHKVMVENAVRAVMQFIDTMSRHDSPPPSPTPSSSSRSQRPPHYTGGELEFAYVVSSLHMLGNLICYKHGRAFFPVKLKDRDAPVTVTALLVSLIRLVTKPSDSYDSLGKGPHLVFNPCSLVLQQVIRKVCSSEAACRKCMCTDQVTDTLLAPIKHLLDKSKAGSSEAPSERTLFQVADILALIASTSSGRKHLMYGETHSFMSKKPSSSPPSPAHTLAQFSVLALGEQLASPPSKAAIGNYVYVCRQLYNTCEGLQIMLQYGLHEAIATAWRQANREADNAATPTPSSDGKEDRDSQYILLWEDTLRDNLLNFAGTPKGVMLLEQTGAMNECVAYMYSRYERKLQVSKCEKFGYGYMMSHVAATAPGMVALRNTGFMQAQILPLWGALEVVDDNPLYTPKHWPVLTIDKSAKKSFINLMNLLSSYCAVYEILGQQPLPTKPEYTLREIPDTIPALFDRIVMVDSDAKIHALFHYEQTHAFGLRLLSVLTSCLDTCLLLLAQYDFQRYLLAAQGDNVIEGSSNIIVDMLSLERHYILVKTYVVGGPSERLLPPRTLPDDGSFPFPLFSAYPDMKQYVQPVAKSAMKQETELSKFLAETKKGPFTTQWQDKCRRALCSVMTAKPDQPIKGNVLQDLLERSVAASNKNPAEAVFPLGDATASEASLKSISLSAVQEKGIAMVVRYGQQLKILSSAKEATENLSGLVRQVEHFLQQQQKLMPKKSPILSLSRYHTGFDWFTATVFLLMGGNRERAWKLLHKTSSLLAAGYIWSRRLHASSHIPVAVRQSGIPPVFSATCHSVELILQTEIAHVYSAFKMSGYAPAQIVQQWLRQCFWTYLDWSEICHYVCVCLVLGADYQVYMCVAILKFLQTQILRQTQEKDLIVFLKEEPIRGFKVGVHLEYMQQLQSKYRSLVLTDMIKLATNK